jgi:hypothetical protein
MGVPTHFFGGGCSKTAHRYRHRGMLHAYVISRAQLHLTHICSRSKTAYVAFPHSFPILSV